MSLIVDRKSANQLPMLNSLAVLFVNQSKDLFFDFANKLKLLLIMNLYDCMFVLFL